MKKNRKTYSLSQKLSAVFMILALCWLTVSAPFVFACQQELAKQGKIAKAAAAGNSSDDESAKTGGSTTEEKVPSGSGNTFSEEYLHEHHTSHYFVFEGQQFHKSYNSGVYIAFHGELLVPPPNAS